MSEVSMNKSNGRCQTGNILEIYKTKRMMILIYIKCLQFSNNTLPWGNDMLILL